MSDKFTITPGLRFEYIKTESAGTYRQVNFDNAGNPINNQELTDNRTLGREFLLTGIGFSYKLSRNSEFYANISQNYRSVTFSDIRVVSPTFIIDPNIQDEKGYTGDFGWRGRWKKYLTFDLGAFALRYNNRIGIILDDRANRVRKNIGTAFIYGLESYANWNITETMGSNQYLKFNLFANTAITGSEYIQSDENNVRGNTVEFIPQMNIKTGVKAGYKNFLCSVQYSYLSEQFTDAENSQVPDASDNRNGVIGEIPAYGIMDLSTSLTINRFTLEAGILNVLDEAYFTRRATGYPGPGIIPSDGRSYYLTVGIKI